MKIISQNKKAHHDYFLLDTYEAGIELKGTEIKSVRLGNVNLKDSFVRIKNDEVYVENMHIAPYDHGNICFTWNIHIIERNVLPVLIFSQ